MKRQSKRKPKKPQRQYLVAISTDANDIPVQLFSMLGDARKFARQLDIRPSIELEDVMGGSVGGPICISIFMFRDGKLVRRETMDGTCMQRVGNAA